MDEKLNALLEYVKSERRICPNPQEWNTLWKMLPGKKRVGSGWAPPLPLILGAWWLAAPSERQMRLMEHIHYAAEHGALAEVDDYLRALRPEQWFYEK